MKHSRGTGAVLVVVLLAGCGEAVDARPDGGWTGGATSAAHLTAGGSDDFPCSLITVREIGDLLGATELRAVPLDNTCSWVDPQRQGVEMYVNTSVDLGVLGAVCDGSVPRTLDECGWSPDGDFETVRGIGREARLWHDQPDYFDSDTLAPARWAAEALSGNDVITVYVNESFGRDAALRVLRAAVEKMAGGS
jgi:hypothetical protein